MVIILSGGFDPIHDGHINMIEAAAELGEVIILLNSDEWLTRKKGRPFQEYRTRRKVLSAIKGVSDIFSVNDADGSVVEGLQYLKNRLPKEELAFGNGGDRTAENTPEIEYCQNNDIQLLFGLGGEKVQSSSALLNAYVHECKLLHPKQEI